MTQAEILVTSKLKPDGGSQMNEVEKECSGPSKQYVQKHIMKASAEELEKDCRAGSLSMREE